MFLIQISVLLITSCKRFPFSDTYAVGPSTFLTSCQFMLDWPSPPVMCAAVDKADFWEIYSPPRLAPLVDAQGPRAKRSIDLPLWDLRDDRHVENMLIDLQCQQTTCTMISSPCTYFPQLMYSNWCRMPKCMREEKAKIGAKLLEIGVAIAKYQVRHNNFYVMEHPTYASSWTRKSVIDLLGYCVIFDQCMVGLMTKFTKMPLKKTTILKTNSRAVLKSFANLRCDNSHCHGVVRGSEGGEKVI